MLKRIRELLGGRGKKGQVAATELATQTAPAASPRPAVHRGPQVAHRPIAPSDLDPDAIKIVQRLTRFDHSAYLVGGCVRDLLLERKPKDFDIGTSATPRQVKRLFRNCRIIGRRFRLAHVYFQNGKIIEVATFRAHDPVDDGEAGDLMIRDDNVFGTPEEDALRRDFTINSLFYDLRAEAVLDHADGLGDLRRRLVRCIGDPTVRFREDPIRCLRAIKFAARLDFAIEDRTLAALESTRDEIAKAAPPRVLEEINRMARGGAARRSFELMRETGVAKVVLPELAGRFAGPAWELSLALLDRIDRSRFGDGREIRTGEILATLLLPVVFPAGGPPGGGDVRDRVDEVLRPLALRLRVPRREQEHCRQILGSLWRMVPVPRARRGVQRAILRRECWRDAMWMLETIAPLRGAEFTSAVEFWKQAGARDETERGPAAPRPEARESEAGAEPEGGQRRSRRRRSRRRGRKAAAAPGGSPPAPLRAATSETKRDLPPVWDDDYFFAALPEAPDTPRDETDDETHAYGGTAVSNGSAEPPREQPAAAAAATGDGRPRRRRRSRRRRRPGPPRDAAASADRAADEAQDPPTPPGVPDE